MNLMMSHDQKNVLIRPKHVYFHTLNCKSNELNMVYKETKKNMSTPKIVTNIENKCTIRFQSHLVIE